MTTTSTAAKAPERGGFAFRWWPINTASWMAAGFIGAVVLTAIIIVTFGAGDRGTGVALRVTARWSFLFFWLAYAGGAMAKLCGPRLGELARSGRELGLGFASAQLVHVGLVLWFIHIANKPLDAMIFFWAGILCTYLLAFFSLPRLRDALGPRLWRLFLTISLEYIAIVFAADFILAPLQATGLGRYPLTYLPFALMLVAGAGLRVAAFSDRGWLQEVNRRHRKESVTVWPFEIFVGSLLIALALGHASRTFFGAALVLYGPVTVAVGAYLLFRFAVHRAKVALGHFK
jgi:hypothetical protein